jgi:exodeoxyribonuclease V alpha subunit
MTETRTATITEIRWQKVGNPWKRVMTDDPQDRAWTGPLGDVVPGTILTVEGEQERHPKFGRSFKVARVLEVGQPEGASVEQWIALRLPDIGEQRAKQLIEVHGEQIWDALSQQEALTALRGITAERAAKIVNSFHEHETEGRFCCYLADHQLQLGLALKAWQHFTKEEFCDLPKRFEEDPYCLVEVSGITFQATDACALALGIDPRDPRRVRAMSADRLDQAASKYGHCHEPRMQHLVGVAKAVGLRGEHVADILWDSDHVTLGSDYVALRRLAGAEQIVAENLRSLAATGERTLSAEPELPEWLDPSQRAAVHGLLSQPVAVLTGGPGTGKTTCLKTALSALEAEGRRITLCAPTGKAAKRMAQVCERPAATIHRTLQWHPVEGWRCNATAPIDADVVVVDESSMIDIELMAALVQGVSHSSQLILVGDVDQLPPVGPGCPLADLIASEAVPAFRLTTTHRQAGESWVIDNAKAIIGGEAPSLAAGGGFELQHAEDSRDIVDALIALYEEHGMLQVLTPVHKDGAGTIRCNLALQEALNPKSKDAMVAHVKAGGYKICASDRVLYTRNNVDIGLVNGDMGVCLGFEGAGDTFRVLVRFEGTEHEGQHGPSEGSKFAGETDVWALSTGDAAPLTLAYAMSVHKSQGSEWPHVVVVVDTAHRFMSRRLLYTAITRTSDRLTLVGAPEAVTRAVGNTRGQSRLTKLQQRLQGEVKAD